jgi:methylated-DNA-[protein]-cysteine S-methyltransferase
MKSEQIVRNELVMDTPVGKLRLVASNKGLTAIDVKATYSKLATKPDGRAQEILAETRKQLTQYFAGDRKKFDLPAKAMRKAKAFRAVGSANGKNPIPIIIPCHRVIASNGGLGGYSLGLKMKRQLMKLEGISAAG